MAHKRQKLSSSNKYSHLTVVSVHKVVRRTCTTDFELARGTVLKVQDKGQEQGEPLEHSTDDCGEDQEICVRFQKVQKQRLASIFNRLILAAV